MPWAGCTRLLGDRQLGVPGLTSDLEWLASGVSRFPNKMSLLSFREANTGPWMRGAWRKGLRAPLRRCGWPRGLLGSVHLQQHGHGKQSRSLRGQPGLAKGTTRGAVGEPGVCAGATGHECQGQGFVLTYDGCPPASEAQGR